MDRQLVKDIIFPRALNQRVLRIQNREEEIDPLISEYKPFILATARRCSYKSYITEQDDEYSVALMAFAEAVQAYRKDKGNFLSFAKRLIRMRCIDYYRKNKRETGGLASLDRIRDDSRENSLLHNHSLQEYAEAEAAWSRAQEIEQLRQELAKWNITFSELVQVSPKQAKTRQACRRVVHYLLTHEEKRRYLLEKQMLPLSDIEKDLHIPRKQIERLRKYIIAVLIIKTGDYPFLQDYVRDWGCDQ